MVNFAWVTRPERPKGAKDEVKRPEGPPIRSRGPEGPPDFQYLIILNNIWKHLITLYNTWHLWEGGFKGVATILKAVTSLNQLELFLHFDEYHPCQMEYYCLVYHCCCFIKSNMQSANNCQTHHQIHIISSSEYSDHVFCVNFSISIVIGKSSIKVCCQVRLDQLIKYEIVSS